MEGEVIHLPGREAFAFGGEASVSATASGIRSST